MLAASVFHFGELTIGEVKGALRAAGIRSADAAAGRAEGAGGGGEMRRAAEATPAHRDRYVDLLRAVAISAVVAGHWLVVHVTDEGGGLSGTSVLDVAAWTRPLTWLFQVMPVFFLVGGYANTASLTSYLRRGGNATGWTLRRTDRLVRPTTTLLAVLAAAALAARAAGVGPQLVGLGVWLAGIPLWFLVAYLAAVVFTPLMYAPAPPVRPRRAGRARRAGRRWATWPGSLGGAVAGGGELPVRLARRAPARHRLAGGGAARAAGRGGAAGAARPRRAGRCSPWPGRTR